METVPPQRPVPSDVPADAGSALSGAVVLITGVMAAGKSTVAQALAERLPRAAHVRGDVFRRMIVSGRREMLPEHADPGASAEAAEAHAQLRLRYRLAAAAAEGYAAAGFTAVLQDIVLGEELAYWVDLPRGRPRYLVVLAPRPETVAEREAGRAKTGYGPWTVEELDRSLRTGTPRLGLWLDTSGQTPEQTVDAILDRLPQARIDD
ncbi:AAA family ATPase [Allostreptomyces psammosilenae]|uniref:Chloramphenicol 3-O-phosphotransferase n=1 Tax=Allostreptomyces psammosilenae TaxID=1892865 RepID=A0A852ZQX7_9ACTN|nr:AAA family ATPase [Allostreptomyces psammosilenae]NYI03690.1 chloramphenicol 3-O-phosphotransferase [Allostreptomyces psammosilenae]